MDRLLLTLALAALFGGHAVAADAAIPAASGPTFVAHEVHGGLAIDHMDGGKPATAEAAHWFRMPGDPTLVVRDGRKEPEALWLTEPAHVVVRTGASEHARFDGEVKPSWTDNAIRLTIQPARGPVLMTDTFTRLDSEAGPRELSRNDQLSIDLEGEYRAALRTQDGKAVGWLAVHVYPDGTPTTYEAALPAGVDEGLAVASAEALSSEIDWIEQEVVGAHRNVLRRP
jgi:hypothetical protein